MDFGVNDFHTNEVCCADCSGLNKRINIVPSAFGVKLVTTIFVLVNSKRFEGNFTSSLIVIAIKGCVNSEASFSISVSFTVACGRSAYLKFTIPS
ncbi:hypothetical protein D3C84_970450 [compost metagenome]